MRKTIRKMRISMAMCLVLVMQIFAPYSKAEELTSSQEEYLVKETIKPVETVKCDGKQQEETTTESPSTMPGNDTAKPEPKESPMPTETSGPIETTEMPASPQVTEVITASPAIQENGRVSLKTDCIQMNQGTIEKIQWENWSEGVTVTYVSDLPDVVTVLSDGTLVSGKIDGTTVVHASVTKDNVVSEYTITVVVSGFTATGITLNAAEITMQVGDEYQLPLQLIPEDAKDKIYFNVSDPEVVSVDESGKIIAFAQGMVDIQITLANGATLTYKVTVGNKVSKITFPYLNKEKKLTVALKQKRRVRCLILPEDAINKKLHWESENEKIAKVNQDGEITGQKIGNTRITVTTTDGSNISESFQVHVEKRKEGTQYSEKGLNIVSTNHQKYTYAEMTKDIKSLQVKYGEFFAYEKAGKSWDNRDIYELTLGNPKAKKTVFIQASMHAREYMASQLVMKQVEFYCANYYTGTYQGKYFNELFDDVCLKIIPMTNPDGVTISQYGYVGIRNSELRSKVRSLCKKYGRGRRSYYTTWKANARGVDLNRNFDCNWSKLATDIHSPRSMYFKGYKPASEKETQIIVKETVACNPVAVISYHAMGRIIYWNFGQKGGAMQKERALLNTVRSICGYSPVWSSFSSRHSTGYGDWVAIKKKLPTTTIEIGSSACPLPQWQFSSVWNANRLMLTAVAKLYQ